MGWRATEFGWVGWVLAVAIGCGGGGSGDGASSSADGGSGPGGTSEGSLTGVGATTGGDATGSGASTAADSGSSTTGCPGDPPPDLPYTGVVSNADELAALPPLHWATVASSRPDNVEMMPDEWPDFDGAVSASYDSYQRVIGFRGLVAAWNSGVAGRVGGAPALLMLGGGHNDYGGNEIIAFDVEALAWSRLIDPTAFPNRAPDFMNPDGTPVSRHTYSGLVWLEHRSELFILGGSPDYGPGACGVQGTWLFDPDAASYTLSEAAGEPGTACDDAAAYDPDTGRVYYNGSGRWAAYDPDGDAWADVRDGGITNQTNLVVDPVRRRLVAIGGGEVRSLDLDAADLAETMLAPVGPTVVQDADDPGLLYDPVLDRIVGYDGGASLFTLDLDAEAWEELAPDPANLVSPENTASGGIFGRLRYFPSINAYVYVNSTQQDVAVYRATPGDCVDP